MLQISINLHHGITASMQIICKDGALKTKIFGKTYCPLLAKYIDTHFTSVAVFGDWGVKPREPWSHHGTKILKRVDEKKL